MKKVLCSLIITMLISISIQSNVFAVSVSKDDLTQVQEIFDLIDLKYKIDVPKDKLIEGALNGMMNALDPHSAYFTEAEYEDMIKSLNGEYFGIGVYIKKVNRFIQATGVIKDSPADRAGIKVGDKFYSVNGKSAYDMDSDEFVSIVRGPKGTKVELEVVRDTSTKPIKIEIVRDSITIEPVEYKIIKNDIGYIKINEFGEDVSSDVEKALKDFSGKKVEKLIIDLRQNPGGYLSEVIEIGKKFIPAGPIVHVKEKKSPLQTYYSKLSKIKYNLVVLVDGGSASASEIFAGAVKDTKAGIVVGTKTYGKGTVQTFFRLSNGAYVKLTIADYLTPKQTSIDGVGLTPDVVIENNNIIDTNSFEKLNFFRNIYPQNKGKDVLAVEQRLEALGYEIDGPDYIYDNITQKAIIKLKKEHKFLASSLITKDVVKTIDNLVNTAANKDVQIEKAIEILNK